MFVDDVLVQRIKYRRSSNILSIKIF